MYFLSFEKKCQFYNEGVSFFDVPKQDVKLKDFAQRQIACYNRPNDAYIDKAAILAGLLRAGHHGSGKNPEKALRGFEIKLNNDCV